MHTPSRHPFADAGFSLVETMVAASVLVIFMLGAFAINGHALRLLKASKESVAVEQCIRDRLERMRGEPMARMISSGIISTTVLSSGTFPQVPGLAMTVTVSGYLALSGTGVPTPVIVSRNSSGTVSVVSAGDGTMNNQRTVKAHVRATWLSANRTRTREAYTLVTKSGINRPPQ